MPNIYSILLNCIAIIPVVYIHEISKAYTSYKLGDIDIKNNGKLSLNPLTYIEPLGFLIFAFTGCGWSKPTETSALYYKNRRRGVLLTYTVPILVSLILGIISMVIYVYTGNTFIKFFTFNNLRLAIFNLIPIYPLCGEKILMTLLPSDKAFEYSQIEKVLQILIVLFLLSGYLTNILNFIVNFIYKLILLILV